MADAYRSAREEREARFDTLRSRWRELADRVRLGHLRDELEDVEGRIEALRQRVTALRRRGYIYGRGWEEKAEALARRWPERQREARRLLSSRERELRRLADEVERLCDRPSLPESQLDRLEHRLERLASSLDEIEREVRGTYDTLEREANAFRQELKAVEFMLDALDSATFKLHPDEHAIAACEAIWISDREEPKGILFLTEGRLIFEQREKKAKKKVLFITTKAELVQEKLWESPVGAVAEVRAEDKRKFLSRKELLHLRFSERTRELPGEVTLQLKGTTNEAWLSLIRRVQNGEIEAERYETEQTEAAPTPPPPSPAEIPTKCPACGGKLPPIFKGMREVTCEYCGTVVRW